MMAELSELPLDRIDDHPDNPRVTFRDDVISGIAANLQGGTYPKEHAIRVRPVRDRFQVVAGHHRIRGARTAGLPTVWAWVRDMPDDEALMELVLDNSQGELSPLELGMHVLRAVPTARGRKGAGLQAYADRVGKTKQYIAQVRAAAEVATTCQVDLTSLQEKAQHLAAIHKAEPSLRPLLVKAMLSKGWSVGDAAHWVGKVRDFDIPDQWQGLFLPLEAVVQRSLDGAFSPSTVRHLVAAVEATRKQIESYDVGAEPYLARFDQWLRDNTGGEAWDVRKIRRKHAEILAHVEKEQTRTEQSWCLGDWRAHVDKLADASVALVLTDPPYGIAFQNRGKATQREVLQNDDLNAPQEVRESLSILQPKLKEDAHVLCFCHWSNEPQMRAAVEAAGYAIRGSLIWVKNNHSMGSPHAFASKHERIVHAVKGSPALFERDPDVLEYARASNERHPTEKPVDLLRRLIEVTTAEGELVADPFGGVASTAVAATQLERRFWSCEIEPRYHTEGLKRLRE